MVDANVAQGRQARCEEGEGAVLEESKCEHISRTVERPCGQGVCPEWEVAGEFLTKSLPSDYLV